MMEKNNANDYPSYLDAMRRENRINLHEAALRWNELANKRSADLNKHLFTIASLIIPLSFFPITNPDLLLSMNFESKLIIIGAWSTFILSLISGLIHLIIEVKFFNNWAEQENTRSDKYSEGIFTKDPEKAFTRLEKMNKESQSLARMSAKPTGFFLYLQQALLITGILMIGIVLSLRLFTI